MTVKIKLSSVRLSFGSRRARCVLGRDLRGRRDMPERTIWRIRCINKAGTTNICQKMVSAIFLVSFFWGLGLKYNWRFPWTAEPFILWPCSFKSMLLPGFTPLALDPAVSCHFFWTLFLEIWEWVKSPAPWWNHKKDLLKDYNRRVTIPKKIHLLASFFFFFGGGQHITEEKGFVGWLRLNLSGCHPPFSWGLPVWWSSLIR